MTARSVQLFAMSNHIGKRIREARIARGISMRQLASVVGLHYSHLSKVENGKDTIGKNSLIMIAEALEVDVDFMLGEAGYQSRPFRVLGNIAAGVPVEATESYETLDLATMYDPDQHFLLRVRGDSMILDGIHDGDMAIVRHAHEAKSGDTVVAIVQGTEATLKRLKKQGRNVVLIPANEQMEEMTFPASQVEIRGVLVGVLRTDVR